MAYHRLDDPQMAERHLRRAVELNGANLEAVGELAALYDASGRRAEADRLLAETERTLASTEPRPDRGAALYLARARHALAVAAPSGHVAGEFRKALALSPGDVAVRLEFAHWLDRVGRNAEAVPILRDALGKPPHDPHVVANLAWALAESGGDLGEARQWLKLARDRPRTDPYLSDTEAWIEFRDGHADQAWAVLQASLGQAEQMPEIAYHAAAILERLGRRDQALPYARAATRLGADFARRADAEALLRRLQAHPAPALAR